MNDRRIKGLEKEIARIIGTAILLEINNEKIKNLVTVYKAVSYTHLTLPTTERV